MAQTKPNAIEVLVEEKRGNDVLKTKKIIVQKNLPPFNCMALEGGGVCGTAYAGLAKVLEKYGLCPEYIAGSSAGSIAALALALGYSAEEMDKILRDLPMAEFLEDAKPLPKTFDLLSMGRQALTVLTSKKNSLSSGKKFLEWLENLVEKKLGNKKATFRDLANAIEQAKKRGDKTTLKHLLVVATNLSLTIPESEVFSF